LWKDGAAAISRCRCSLFVVTIVVVLVVDGASLAHVHPGLCRPFVRPVLEPDDRVPGLQLIVSEFPDVLLALAGPVTVGAAVARLCLCLKDRMERSGVTDECRLSDGA